MGRIYDLFVSKYNYTDFHELNLDWLIAAIKQMEYEIENFVSINAVKYADPIEWDITRQYEKNTIVIDAITGTAYISSKPVPMGVALSNSDYWNVVFDLGRFITLAAQNFADSYEPVTTTTATVPTQEGKWLVWNSILYQALNDIHVGDMYVEDGNIKHRTVEYFFNQLKDEEVRIELELGDLIASEVSNRIAEDARIELELRDLITSKINIEAQTRSDEDTRIELELRDLITSKINIEATARSDEDIIINARIDQIIEDLPNFDNFITPEEYGAVGDGLTDDTAAINTALSAASDSGKVFLFTGKYLVDGHYTGDFHTTGLQIPSNIIIRFASGASVKQKTADTETCSVFTLLGVENVDIGYGEIIGDYQTHIHGTSSTHEWCHGITVYGCKNINIHNMTLRECYGDGIYVGQYPYYGGTRPDNNHNANITLDHIRIDHAGRNGISFTECDGWSVDNVYATNISRTLPKSAIDFELEGDYSPYLSSGTASNVDTKSCDYSIKVTRIENEIHISNITGNRIYCESNVARTRISQCIAPMTFSESEVHVYDSTCSSMVVFGAKAVWLDNVRVTWAQNAQAQIRAHGCIFTNPIGYTQSCDFEKCLFLWDGAASYMASLRSGNSAHHYIFSDCTFDYGSYGGSHNAISDSSDAGCKLIVVNCNTNGTSDNISNNMINSAKTAVINGNCYKHYNAVGGTPVSGCVNFNY